MKSTVGQLQHACEGDDTGAHIIDRGQKRIGFNSRTTTHLEAEFQYPPDEIVRRRQVTFRLPDEQPWTIHVGDHSPGTRQLEDLLRDPTALRIATRQAPGAGQRVVLGGRERARAGLSGEHREA